MRNDRKRPGGDADPGAGHRRNAAQSTGRGEADSSTGPAPDDDPAPTGTSQDYDHGQTREAEAEKYAPGGLVRPDERYSDQEQYGQAGKEDDQRGRPQERQRDREEDRQQDRQEGRREDGQHKTEAAPDNDAKGTCLRPKSDRD